MKTVKTFARQLSFSLMMAMTLGSAIVSCGSILDEEDVDCSVEYRVKFKYDYNMKYADAFSREVGTVTLYAFDDNGKLVYQKTEEGDVLGEDGYTMKVDLEPGDYHLITWAGLNNEASFSVPLVTAGESSMDELQCKMDRMYSRAEDGTAIVNSKLSSLWHGEVTKQSFSRAATSQVVTVPLVKNTNNVRVVLQHLSGGAVDKDKFVFTITDTNGSMDWDNTLLPDEPVTYYAWHTDAGEVDMDTQPEENQAASRATFSAAIAELTVPRLVKGQETRLTVTNKVTGKAVFSIPLIDYALLVKGFYNRDMDDQEYLDRQDVYDMVFFLDEGDRWLDAYIYINSWKVVLQNSEL